ncbi:MAG: response regulator transcription factor [Acidobacteria bacterium]|nr:response regulator transcription factor [Acidobacteriota bacterium]MDA1234950.1 response regulator transcription factor [Acidobacteriota bacterium]
MSLSKTSACTKVCLVASQALLREGLKLLIEAERDLCVAPSEEADIVILDLADEDALTTLQQGSGRGKSRFIVLTESSELAELDCALRAGARGIVVKSAHPASLLQAIRSVSRGLKWLDPEIQQKLSSPDSILPTPQERWRSLSKRERQIAELVLQSLRYKDVADSLHISEHTVRNHLRSVFTKLRITSRVELAPYAGEAVST